MKLVPPYKARSKRTSSCPIVLPPNGAPLVLPVIIEQRLKGLSGRVLLVAWAETVLWLVVIICLLVLIQTGIDWLMDLSWRGRVFLILGDVLLMSWIIFDRAVRPWLKRLSVEQAALHAEIFWPDMQTSLISAVQLARRPEGSRKLVEVLIQQVAARLEKLDLRKAVATRQLRRIGWAALVLVLVVAGLGIATQPKSLILLRRLLLSREPLPTQTVVVPISTDISIQPGQGIELSARATGVIPRSGRIEITYDGKPTQNILVQPTPAHPNLFSLNLPNVQQPLTYRFFLNDGKGLAYKVRMLNGPVLEKTTFDQIYPAYTGLAKTRHSAGNLTLLAGSRLEITGVSNQTLKSAQVISKGKNGAVEVLVTDAKKFKGEIKIPADGMDGFSMILSNSDGVQSQNNALYQVEITPDKAPEIVIAPGQPDRTTLVVTARPRLRFEVRDDFQTKQVFLCVQTDLEGADPTVQKPIKILLDVPKPARALAFDYEWKNPEQSGIWKEGSTINYWIEAIDNNDVTGPGVGRSPNRQWQVISLEAKRDELTERLRQRAESMEDLSRTQEELRGNVGDLLKQEVQEK